MDHYSQKEVESENLEKSKTIILLLKFNVQMRLDIGCFHDLFI